MRANLYIFTGFDEDPDSPAYKTIGKFFRRQNVSVVFVDIYWKRRSLFDFISDFFAQYEFKKNTPTYFFGFSLGALLALALAPSVKPAKLFLCSLSPFFREDIKKSAQSVRCVLGKRRTQDFASLRFAPLAAKIHGAVTLFVGSSELPTVKRRAMDAARKLPQSRLVTIADVDHSLNNRSYLNAVGASIADH